MGITEIAYKSGTSKVEHDYFGIYEKILSSECKSLLEIGIDQGGSAKMWREFMPHADIWFLDLFNEFNASMEWCKSIGITPIQGSQSDMDVLKQVTRKFDVIIDDGSHNAYDQLVSLEYLFNNCLNDDGIYIIEDCQCNKEPFYWGNGVTCFKDTPLWIFKNWVDTGDFKSRFIHELNFSKVQIETDEKLIIIYK